MIKISAKQMHAINGGAPRSFAKRLAMHLETEFSGRVAHSGETIPAGPALEQRVLELVSKAQSFNMTRELAVGQFVSLGLGYSRNFYDIGGVASMLKDPVYTPDENMRRVLDAVIDAETRAA